MAKYRLSTGLSKVREEPEFDTDKEAWDYLRAFMPGKFACLYKEVDFSVALNNETKYVDTYNKKYAPSPIGHGPSWAETLEVGKPVMRTVWIPVLEGVTDHEYNVK
jgi:hypothetical protein